MAANPKITEQVGKTIRSAKKRGLGGPTIVALVLERHGVQLDRRTIDRYLAANPPRQRPKRTDPAGTDPASDLDELETLRARARELHQLLATNLSPGNVVKVNAELRQTFKSIRGAEAARIAASKSASTDATWVLAKLKRFDAMNRGEIVDDATDSEGVPAAAGAANGG
jgi:hypothetical protein